MKVKDSYFKFPYKDGTFTYALNLPKPFLEKLNINKIKMTIKNDALIISKAVDEDFIEMGKVYKSIFDGVNCYKALINKGKMTKTALIPKDFIEKLKFDTQTLLKISLIENAIEVKKAKKEDLFK